MITTPRFTMAGVAHLVVVPSVELEERLVRNERARGVDDRRAVVVDVVDRNERSSYLLAILAGKGLAFAAAVAVGALVGPSQVGTRAIALALSRRQHPIWTKVAASSLVVLGLVAQ